jgi:hypothetical protein
VFCIAVILAYAYLDARAADDATATLRREHREEVMELRQQQSQEAVVPDASGIEGAKRQEIEIRQRAAQEQLHARQLREQLQSAQIRQLQERGEAAGQAQHQLQRFRRERDAVRLQRQLLQPPPIGSQRR